MRKIPNKPMRGLARSPVEQALTNAEMALRVLAMAPRVASELTPHPLDIVRAELENVRRYLGEELEQRAKDKPKD